MNSKDAALLFFLAFTPLAHRAYLALAARTPVPPQPHDIVNTLPAWFTFAAVGICFSVWVTDSMEKWLWITTTGFALTYGLWQLTVSWGMQPLLSQVLWGINNLAAVVLALHAWRLYRSKKQAY